MPESIKLDGHRLAEPFHRGPYPAISPLRPELSQAGKTVVITGGSMGIGYAIAQAFVAARAAKIIILARRAETVSAAAAKLAKEAAAQGSKTEIVGLPCDVGDAASVAEVWGRLAGEGTVADVLVLNAAAVAPVRTIMELGTARLWEDYTVNVRGQLDMTERFYKQRNENGNKLYLVYVSTQSIHQWESGKTFPGYGLTKNAGTAALQVTSHEVPVDRMQMVLYHPGGVLTESAEKNGFTQDSLDWDDAALPGNFAVWAASPEAAFLHGRFVWASWDVDGMKNGEVRKRMDEDPYYLQVGVKGL
ncbi:NAD(P)-binding protein [Hypoxylon cercidicola]|nr:NAD(P)-binding protein [Hypoxylon cercidicola]